MESARDEFSQATKDELAKRAGYICSYPGCHRLTVGPSSDRVSGVTLVGVAAHITAASDKGPRYDETLSPDERKSERNGIWVCSNHGKFIDDNPSRCTIPEIQRWKKQHEEWIFARVETGQDLVQSGLVEMRLDSIGCLGSGTIRLGRHNLVLGGNDSGKSTLCEAIAAYSGGAHYEWFVERFGFGTEPNQSSMQARVLSGIPTVVRLTCRADIKPRGRGLPKVLVEVNGGVKVDWPRSLFNILHFDRQLEHRSGGLRDRFRQGICYLADTFRIPEKNIWDSITDDLYTNTLLGYRFRRVARYRIEALVPDGRAFYCRTELLSESERVCALIDIAMQFVKSSGSFWTILYDSGFYGRLDLKHKKLLFNRVTTQTEGIQSICPGQVFLDTVIGESGGFGFELIGRSVSERGM